MEVKPLTVGPIIGHTSNNSVRIFGRAQLSIEGGRPRKTHGIIRYREQGSEEFLTPLYFKMNPNFDLTGVVILNSLASSTIYEYQVGWFYSDVDSDTIDVNNILDWSSSEIFTFKTASDDNRAPRNIIFGSCRYILRLFGGVWWDDRSDKTFRTILKHHSETPIDQVIMCGDQIYADDLNIIGADNGIDQYNSRYQKAFSTPYLRKMMSSIPTYMTLDDHEIEDNWPESASKKDWVKKFPAAIHAYSTYQASHSPLFALNGNRITGTPTHLWYKYTDGCCDFFVTDCRTERYLEDGEREIIGPRQMKELLTWLMDGSGRVKLIITSVPLYESESSDKWHGFITQRDMLLECIVSNQVQKVVFLSGDVHACMASQLKLDENLTVTSIVSSAFFWPYPHPKRKNFKLLGNIKTNANSLYQIMNATEVYPTDAFSKLAISPEQVEVLFFSRKYNNGATLGSKVYNF